MNLSSCSRLIITLLRSTLLYTVGFPFFILLNLILLGPIWLAAAMIVRSGVIAASKRFVAGIGKPLSWRDVFLLENYAERHTFSIVTLQILEGDMSAATLQKIFSEDVLAAKISSEQEHSRLRFPELKQVQTSFLGFSFWKEDPHFQIGNHIKDATCDEPTTPSYFKSYEGMLEEFTGRPYKPHSSPWEFWVVRRFPQEGKLQTVLLWRSHHSLMDGHSIVNVTINVLGRRAAAPSLKQIQNATATPLQQRQQQSIKSILTTPLLRAAGIVSGFYHLLFSVFQNFLVKRAIVRERRREGGAMSSMSPAGKIYFRRSSKLPLRRVKDVSASLGIRVPSLLVTLISESLGGVLPPGVEALNSIYVMPRPNHPGTLCNHADLAIVQLPIISVKKNGGILLRKSLQSVNKSLLNLRSSPLTSALHYLGVVVGHFPPAVVSWIASRVAYVPIEISNFSMGNDLNFTIGGLECVDFKGGLAPPRTYTDCFVMILGFKSHIEIVLAAKDSFLSDEQLGRVAARIGENFEKLKLVVAEAELCV